MSLFWWMVKNEQFKYYRNRNREFERREKERKQKEKERKEQELKQKQKRIEEHKKYLAKKEIEDEIKYLENTIDAIKYPMTYNTDNHIVVNRELLIDLNNRINKLKKQSLKECGACEIKFKFILEYFQEIKEQYSEYFNENNVKKDERPNLSNPKLYNKLMTNIKGKKFKNEKEKMQMIKIVGESGLTVDERKRLISMIK